MFFLSNLKALICEDIYLNLVASEGRILNNNQLLNTNRPQNKQTVTLKMNKNGLKVCITSDPYACRHRQPLAAFSTNADFTPCLLSVKSKLGLALFIPNIFHKIKNVFPLFFNFTFYLCNLALYAT